MLEIKKFLATLLVKGLFCVDLKEKKDAKLTHSFSINPFPTPWKHQKTVRLPDVFWGVEKGWIGNKWVKNTTGRLKF